MALVASAQSSFVGATATLAPTPGVGPDGLAGAASVVKLHVAPLAPPAEFFARTYHVCVPRATFASAYSVAATLALSTPST